MKCVNCGTDNNLKDRTANQGRCKQCNHPFAFEPTTMSGLKITDSMFAKALVDISVNETLYFTTKQLLYFLDTRLRKKSFYTWLFVIIYIFSNIFLTIFLVVFYLLIPNSFAVFNLI